MTQSRSLAERRRAGTNRVRGRAEVSITGVVLLCLFPCGTTWAQSLEDTNPAARQRALAVAGPADVAAVTSLLADPVLSVRRSARRALVRIGPEALPSILRAAASPQRTRRLERGLARTLADLPASACVPHKALIREAIRPSTAGDLAPLLVRACEAGSPDPASVLRLAEQAPELLQERDWALPFLLRFLEGPDRSAAIEALSELGEGARPAAARLASLLRDPELDATSRHLVARTLGALDERRAICSAYQVLDAEARAEIWGGLAEGGGPCLPALRVLSHLPESYLWEALDVPGELPIWRQAMRSADPRVRDAALPRHFQELSSHALSDLLLALKDPAEEVRTGAVELASRVRASGPGYGVLRARLLELASSDPSAHVRAGASNSLGALSISDDSQVLREGLLRAFASEGDPEARKALRRVLLNQPATPELLSSLRRGAAGDARETGNLLGCFEASLALRQLRGTAELRTQERLIRHLWTYAARTGLDPFLGWTGKTGSGPPLSRSLLLRLLNTRELSLRSRAASLLARLGPRDSEAVEALRELLPSLEGERGPALYAARTEIQNALVGVATPKELRDLLGAGEPIGRRAAREWASRSDATALVDLMNSSELKTHELRLLAPALQARHVGALPALRAELRSGFLAQRAPGDRSWAAVEGVAALGSAAAPALAELSRCLPKVHDSSPHLRRLLEAVARIGAVSPLLQESVLGLTRHPRDPVVTSAHRVLAAWGPDASYALPSLTRGREKRWGWSPGRPATGGWGGRFPQTALKPLAEIIANTATASPAESDRLAQRLVSALDDVGNPKPWLWSALKALEKIGPPARSVAPVLLDHALDPWVEVEERALAAKALCSISPTEAARLWQGLRRALRSSVSGDRVSAARLLAGLGRGGRAPAAVLRGALASPHEDADVLPELAWSLAEAEPESALRLLLETPDARLRQALSAWLAQAELAWTPGLIAVLRRGLEDPHVITRLTCARSILRAAGVTSSEDLSPLVVANAVARITEPRRSYERAELAEFRYGGDRFGKLFRGAGELGEDELEPASRAGALALPALLQAIANDRLRVPALRGIAALGSAAQPAGPLLRRLVTRGEPGCVIAACALLELSPADEAVGRAALRAWLPSLSRRRVPYAAERLGLERGAHWSLADRQLALTALDRVVGYRGYRPQTWDGQEGAMHALLVLGERNKVKELCAPHLPARLRCAALAALASPTQGGGTE